MAQIARGTEENAAVASQAAAAKETGRVEAFSDGVFAIAITLLVLELRVPSGLEGDSALLDSLWQLWPKYVAFVASFFTIGITWVNHHRLFTLIGRTNTPLLLLNLLLLMTISLVPFPTGIVAEYLAEPGGETTAALAYNGLFVVMSIAFNVLWRYSAGNNRLLSPDADPMAVRKITQQYMFGPLFYVAAFVVAFFSPLLSLVIDILLAIFFALPGPPLMKQTGRGDME